MGVRTGRPKLALEDRFWSKVELGEAPDDCWRWTGYINPQGHGTLRVSRKNESTNLKAHRIALSLVGIDVPLGSDAHHVCENRWCVNPDHLEVLPHGEHRRLHNGDYYPQGHPKTPENMYFYKGRPYECRICRKARALAQSRKARALAQRGV